MIPNFCVFVKLENEYIIYEYESKTFITCERLPYNMNTFFIPKHRLPKNKNEIKKDKNKFLSFIHEESPKYAEQLIKDVLELNDAIGFNYFDNSYKFKNGEIRYRSHGSNVVSFFIRLSKKYYEHFEPVLYEEYTAFNKCNNGGLMYLKNKGKYENCYGYDYKMFYSINMKKMNFFIPVEKGEYKYIDALPESHYKKFGKDGIKSPYMLPVQFGIYHVRITSDDPLIKTKFMFSKNNWYTSYSLCQALKYYEKGKHNICVELIIDDKPNAYVYDDTKLVRGFDVFTRWTNRLIELKRDYPQNKIIKFLASSGWGHLNDLVTEFKTEDEVIELSKTHKVSSTMEDNPDYIVHDFGEKCDESLYYELIDVSKPIYKLPLRLLPFITSYSRCRMASVVDYYKLEEHVIRIQTDGI
ncbi:unnamed protein product, partial [Ectocarpus fasciculatus]